MAFLFNHSINGSVTLFPLTMVTFSVTFLKIIQYLTAMVKWDEPIKIVADETTMKGVQDLGRRKTRKGVAAFRPDNHHNKHWSNEWGEGYSRVVVWLTCH